MTDKDRLEEIKEYFGLWMKNDISRDWSLSSETIDNLKYLIEQAERVKGLEKRFKIYQKRSWFEDYEKVAKQNKRYREAIEKAMSEMQTLERYGNENAIAAYVTLKEALEGNK